MTTLYRVYFENPVTEPYESIYTTHTGPKTLAEIDAFFKQTVSMPSKPTIDQAMRSLGYSIIIRSVKD